MPAEGRQSANAPQIAARLARNLGDTESERAIMRTAARRELEADVRSLLSKLEAAGMDEADVAALGGGVEKLAAVYGAQSAPSTADGTDPTADEAKANPKPSAPDGEADKSKDETNDQAAPTD